MPNALPRFANKVFIHTLTGCLFNEATCYHSIWQTALLMCHVMSGLVKISKGVCVWRMRFSVCLYAGFPSVDRSRGKVKLL